VAKLWKVLALVLAQGAAPSGGPLVLEPVASAPDVVALHVPPIPRPLAERVRQYSNVRTTALVDVSEDGKRLLIASNVGNTEQLHRVSQALGTREQLTFFEASVGKAALLPEDPLTLFLLKDDSGGEAYQLQRLDLRTARTELLTDGKSRHETFVLSREGRWIAYSGTGRNGRDTDVYLAEVADARNVRRLTELVGTWLPLEFSPDGQKLLVEEVRGEDDADVSLLDVATGARRLLTPEARLHGKAAIRQALFSSDGKAVYLLTDRGLDFTGLFRLDLTRPGAALEAVVPEVSHDVERVAVGHDGTLVFSTNEAGASKAYLLRGKTLEPLPLPLGVLSGLRFARDRSDAVFLALEGPTSPTDVWELSLKSKKLTRWTKSEVGGLDAATFVSPELVHYPGVDGLALSAFLYRPRDVPKGKRVPVVVSFHDGPASEERPTFRPDYQLLLEQGLAVLAPNVRGSTGFGKAYAAADDGVKRAQVLDDIASTLQWLARQPDLDAAHVAAWGQGYGGYLALASAAFYPSFFRAAVDVKGIPQLSSFVESAPPYRRDGLRGEYGDERLPEVRAVQERISPLHNLTRMQAALLVVQGKKDTRVPRAQAEQLVQARGPDGWYLLALEEGRGPWKKQDTELVTCALLFFLQEKLLEPPRAALH
jgi:dipeptidyl aminopeptidase/acylaminoacyl peptidase